MILSFKVSIDARPLRRKLAKDLVLLMALALIVVALARPQMDQRE